MKTRSVFVAPALAVLLSLTGCFAQVPLSDEREDSTPTAQVDAPAQREELAVVETAFGRQSYNPEWWWYVVIIENSNDDYVFASESIDVEAIDASGVILDTSSNYVTLLSGRTAIVGSFLDAGTEEIVNLDVRGPTAQAAIHSKAEETGSYTFEEVAATSDSYSTTVSGIISGTFAEEQTLLQVNVVARNAAGQIVGGEFSFVDRLPVDGKVRFEVRFSSVMPGDTTYEPYAVG